MVKPRKKAKTALAARKKPTQSRGQVTLASILDAAAHILREGGLDSLNTNHVAEVAGVSIGSLYQYFPSKEAIIAALLMREHDKQMAEIAHVLDSLNGTSTEVAASIIVQSIMRNHARDPKLLQVLNEQLARLGKLNEVVAVIDTTVTQLFAAFLSARQPELQVSDIRLTAFVLTHTIQPFLGRIAFSEYRDSGPAIERELTRLIVGYLTYPKDGSPRPGHH